MQIRGRHPSMMRAILLLIAIAAPLAAQTRDSAGISIIESTSARSRQLAPFRVADRPTLQIGIESGDPNQQFNQVVAIARLGDGSIVIADAGSGELRIFDAAGRFARKLGRKGQGPGEFQYLTDVRGLGRDSLVAWDGTGRFTVFGPTGDVARTFTVQGGPASERGLGLVRGALGDGAFFAYRVGRQPPPQIEAITRDTLRVGVYGRDGVYVHSVADFLGLERLLDMGGSMPGPDGKLVNAWSIKGLPFARETYLRAGGDWLYAGTGDSYEIMAFDRAGRLQRIIRIHEPLQPVTPAIIAQHRKEPRRRDSPSRPNVDPKIDPSWYPKTLPAYGGVRVDAAQRLWVKDYPIPGEQQPRWRVFDRSGALLGSVLTPAGLEVLDIGTDSLVGVWLDENDVEYVRVYALSPRS
jgi:hypothetical protein